jgi:TetR/AcrR family transcriptional repressor of nem operon
MRVSREKAAENRERIVQTAARMFREAGLGGVGAIVSAAGLTHGGFYGHFGSKDDLAAKAVTRALRHGVEKQSRYANLGRLVREGIKIDRKIHDALGRLAEGNLD